MPSEGFSNVGTTVSQAGPDVAWNPTTLTAHAQLDATQKTQQLRGTGLGFTTPGDSEAITGVEVEITRVDLDSSGSIFDFAVQLIVGGSPAGLALTDSVAWGASTTKVYGSSVSLWGLISLSGAQVKASNFGVLVTALSQTGAPADVDIEVSAMKVKIHWGSGGATSVEISGPAVVGRGDKVVLTASEIAGATYSWSSSPGLLNATASGRVYTIDPALQPGKYAITVSVNGGQATDTFILTVVKVEIAGHDTTPEVPEIVLLATDEYGHSPPQAAIPLTADIYPRVPGA